MTKTRKKPSLLLGETEVQYSLELIEAYLDAESLQAVLTLAGRKQWSASLTKLHNKAFTLHCLRIMFSQALKTHRAKKP